MGLVSEKEEETLKCAECGKEFDSVRGLKVHKNKAHSDPDEDSNSHSDTSTDSLEPVQPEQATVEDLARRFKKVQKQVRSQKTNNKKTSTKVEGLEERINSYNERIDTISDRLGSTRESAKNNKKQITETKSAAEKALDLVEQVEPREITKRIESRDAQLDQASTEIEQVRDQVKDLRDNLSDLRDTVRQFKGIEQIKELKKEVRGDLQKAKQRQQEIDIKANQVEDMFLEMEEKVSEIKTIEEAQNTLEDQFHELRKIFDDIQVKVNDIPERQEFEDFKNDIEERTKKLEDIQPAIRSTLDKSNAKNPHFVVQKRFDSLQDDVNQVKQRLEKELEVLVSSPSSETSSAESMDDLIRSYFIDIYEDIAGLKEEIHEHVRSDFEESERRLSRVETAVYNMQLRNGSKSIWEHMKRMLKNLFVTTSQDRSFASHPCEFCNDAQDSQENLRKHRLEDHEEEELVCENCGKLCASSQSLSEHQISAHN